MSDERLSDAEQRSTETPCSGCTLKVKDGIPQTWVWSPEGRLYCFDCAKARRLIR